MQSLPHPRSRMPRHPKTWWIASRKSCLGHLTPRDNLSTIRPTATSCLGSASGEKARMKTVFAIRVLAGLNKTGTGSRRSSEERRELTWARVPVPVLLEPLAILLVAAGLSSAEWAAERLNVIVILTDDQGSIDARCYGAQDLETPAMDRIAAHGVRFTQFYRSDNGHSTEVPPWRRGQRGTVSRRRGQLVEGGIRLPGMISWPGHLPEGTVRDQIAHACDWMPTVAELCGVKLLDEDIDGKSLVSVIRSAAAATPHDVLHWQVGAGKTPQWAVRQGDWKLIGNVEDPTTGCVECRRQEALPGESRNRPLREAEPGQEHPDVLERLLKTHQGWVAAQRKLVSKATYQDAAGNER